MKILTITILLTVLLLSGCIQQEEKVKKQEEYEPVKEEIEVEEISIGEIIVPYINESEGDFTLPV